MVNSNLLSLHRSLTSLGYAQSRMSLSHVIHRHFLWLLVGSYILAGICPECGLVIRKVTFGQVTLWGETTSISLPMVMLALVLLNAGVGVDARRLKSLLRGPWLLLGGLAANLLVPVGFLLAVSMTTALWHNPDEVQVILVGLALVAAMPIAGSSTAWIQNANGDLALGLGLVVGSTFLSPLTTPITFELAEQMATGEYAQVLDQLEGSSTGVLLVLCAAPFTAGDDGTGGAGGRQAPPGKPSAQAGERGQSTDAELLERVRLPAVDRS